MAIQKSIEDNVGVTHTEAYVKVSAVHVGTDSTSLSVNIYHNAAARSKSDDTSIKNPFIEERAWVSATDHATFFADSVLKANTKSPISQAYAWLKTQTDAFDAFESTPAINWTSGTTDV